METKKIGVLGGTFNPIHRGHLLIAHRTQRLFDLSEIHFVVATSPPHKPLKDLVPFFHRYAMVSLATAGSPSLIPSMIELEHPVSPFSLDTLKKFAARRPNAPESIFFIAGGDSLQDVTGWREGQLLLDTYSFVFVVRPGVSVINAINALPVTVRERVHDLRGQSALKMRKCEESTARIAGNRIFIIDAGAPDISSSKIRTLSAEHEPFGHLVPASVHRYIQKLNLYGER